MYVNYGMRKNNFGIYVLHMFCEYVCVKFIFGNIEFKLFSKFVLVCKIYLLEVQFNLVIKVWYCLRIKISTY
jgi:hypothetical protein